MPSTIPPAPHERSSYTPPGIDEKPWNQVLQGHSELRQIPINEAEKRIRFMREALLMRLSSRRAKDFCDIKGILSDSKILLFIDTYGASPKLRVQLFTLIRGILIEALNKESQTLH